MGKANEDVKKIVEELIKEGNDEKYILEADVSKLNLSPSEYEKLIQYAKENGIKHYVETKKERSPRVRDSEYGQHETYGTNDLDQDVYSNIDYEGDQVISEEYAELDRKLNLEFIPNNIQLIQNKRKGEAYFSVQLNKILALKLSEKENQHVIKYLASKGIKVRGMSQNFEEEENYINIHNYHYYDYPKSHTKEENNSLFEQYEKEEDPIKKKAIRDDIVVGNMRLVVYLATTIYLPEDSIVEFDDLVQVGSEPLNYYLDYYDYKMGFAFSTYMYKVIKGQMIRELAERSPFPVNRYEEINRMKKMDAILTRTLGHNPTDKQLADALSISEEKLAELKKANLFSNPKDIDQHTDDIMITDSVEGPAMHKGLQEAIAHILADLNEREREVIILRYGLRDGIPSSLEEVANDFHVTRERIRQIEAKALRKLRHPYRTKHIEDYISLESEDVDFVKDNDIKDMFTDEYDEEQMDNDDPKSI